MKNFATDPNFYFVRVLQSEFNSRLRKNSGYSLRAFAKHLLLNPAELSLILRNKRGMTDQKAERITKILCLSPKEKEAFLNSLAASRRKTRSKQLEDSKKNPIEIEETELTFKIISEWEHFAILSLMDNCDFTCCNEWISERLGIPKLRTEECIRNLEESGYLKTKVNGLNKVYEKVHKDLKTTEDVLSVALMKSHLENSDIAKKKLREVPLELRDFSSVTISLNKKNLTDAKKIIRKFRKEFAELLDSSSGDHVYQINLQLFPLTKIDRG